MIWSEINLTKEKSFPENDLKFHQITQCIWTYWQQLGEGWTVWIKVNFYFSFIRFVKYPKNNENIGAETTLGKCWEFWSKTELKHVIFTFFRRSNVHISRKIQNPLDLSLIHVLPLVYNFMELTNWWKERGTTINSSNISEGCYWEKFPNNFERLAI